MTNLRRRLKDKSDAPAEMRGDLPRMSIRSKKKKKAAFFSPAGEWSLDSGASMHVVSRETVRVSKSPTTVVTANGEVLTKEEATVYVSEYWIYS